ncbi:helix-turn-helix domain-containing protein [Prochlorococcus sp. MIT 0916]|uniref:helix-turn-helix domain-containing protein n=1 Tax=Prochlorococcus sp. MIT 0916 TaxID=3082521 RepID=UPI0039B401F7
MISRRLTKTQKLEILEAYKDGESASILAEKYNCTPATINRTVKTLLSEREYTLLKKKRSKPSNKNEKLVGNETIKEKKVDLEQSNSLITFKEKALSVKVNKEYHSPEVEKIESLDFNETNGFEEDLSSKNQKNKNHYRLKNNQNYDNNFEEIAPLLSSFDFDLEKQKSDFQILNYESLPESVYMIVDKKVELDLKTIADLPEWSFLPKNELQRNAILLFANQRSAKRICSRNQRVIKVPNTNVFKLSKSYLISKGITRLILEDSIIGLDD